MANTTMTNAQALAASIELAKNAGMDELVAKLDKMHATATKPRKKSDTPTKEQLERKKMVDELAAKIQDVNDAISTNWVMDNVSYVLTPQKATAVLNDAIKAGIVVKTDSVKGRTRYIRADIAA